MSDKVLVVSNLSKKYSSSLRRSSGYAVRDLARELLPWKGPPAHLRAGEFWALEDISFSVGRGEALGIIGHNGAGKSTLLKLLYGLIKPDRGEIRINGRTEALLELGTGFNAVLSGRENVRVGAALHGFDRDRTTRLIEEVIDFAELSDFIDSPLQSYSSGMKARLAYALASHLRPDLLLVDEVLAVGDHAFQRKCVAHMLSYLRSGGSVLLVSHNAHHIQAVCQDAILLDHGNLVFQGSAAETLDRMFDMQSRPIAGEPSSPSSPGPVALLETRAENPRGGVLMPDEPMRLILKYRCDETVNVRWGFTIWTSDQWVCITGDSWDVGRELAKGVGELSCTIARLPLMPGHYVVRLAMADSETTFAMFPESTYTLSIEVASPADTRTAYRRAYGQLVPLAAEWE